MQGIAAQPAFPSHTRCPAPTLPPQGNRLSLIVQVRPTAGAASNQSRQTRFVGASNSAAVLAGDLPVCSGAAHAIDAVLLPVAAPAGPPAVEAAGSG